MGSRAYDCNLSYNDIVHELCGSFRLLKTRDTIWKNAACQFKVDRQRAIPLRQLSLFIMPLATRDIKQCCDLSIYPSLLRPVPIWERSVVMSVSVCVCVSVCLSAIISSKPRPIFTKFLVHVTYGRGSVLLWWRNDMLCTSGLWMTSYLLISQGC